jgi:DNA helicase-2/ATP-dependent DNA helicase PcrA
LKQYLSQLNEAQLAPTLQKEGPMIVIAGAGSGKTRVLTYRIAYLMSEGTDPFNILSLTFTNKAAREMKSRIASIVGDSEAKNLWMGTFHSVFAKILRFEADKLGYPSNFTIYDTQDSQRLISSIIKEKKLDKDIYKYKQVHSRISSYKNSLITVKAYFQNPELKEADSMSKRPEIGEIYKEYVFRCFKAGAMDFDDLLLKTNELLTRFPEVLAKYQDRFRYILVDEYQDTNHSQYLIVRALSDRFQNICVVGDDAQSIYAFRGANINNILNFQKDYQDVKMFRLEQNYRSTKNIVSNFPLFDDTSNVQILITIFAIVGGLFQLVFLWNFIHSMFYGKKTEQNPWKSNTLEWTAPVEHMHGNWPGEIPHVHRWAYDYSKPGHESDFVPQNIPLKQGEEELQH